VATRCRRSPQNQREWERSQPGAHGEDREDNGDRPPVTRREGGSEQRGDDCPASGSANPQDALVDHVAAAPVGAVRAGDVPVPACWLPGVWGRLTAELGGPGLAVPSPKALRDLRRRIGIAPVKALLEVLAGPLGQRRTPGIMFGRYRTVAFDGCRTEAPAAPRHRALPAGPELPPGRSRQRAGGAVGPRPPGRRCGPGGSPGPSRPRPNTPAANTADDPARRGIGTPAGQSAHAALHCHCGRTASRPVLTARGVSALRRRGGCRARP
jgi:hypothetical protein